MAEEPRSAQGDALDEDDDEAGGARSLWSGMITFGLVSVPVDLFPAVRSVRPGMRLLDAEGRPLRRQYHCTEDDAPVDRDELVRGYPLDDGGFTVIEDAELEALEPKKSREIDLRRFVDRDAISPLYFRRSYYLAPSGGTVKAYRLLAAAMEKRGLAGIATFVMRGREYLVAIVADDGLLRADVLRFAGELRTPESIGLPEPREPAPERVKEMRAAIRRLEKKSLATSELEDEAAAKLAKIAAAKAKRREEVVEVEEPELPAPGETVIDIVEVLKQRLAAAREEEEAEPATPRSTRRPKAAPKARRGEGRARSAAKKKASKVPSKRSARTS